MMKKFNLTFVIAIITIIGFCENTKAQTKNDLVTCMKKVMNLEDSQVFFQFKVSKAPTVIFTKTKELTSMGIQDEDFRDYAKSVRIWGKEELFMRAIRNEEHLCRIKFDASENEISMLIITLVRKDGNAFYSGAFVLNKKRDDWVIVNQNFNTN